MSYLHPPIVVLALLSSMCASVRVHAQEATEAQRLFERGAELYRERRFGEALEAMVASNRLVPNANVVFNVAQIYELLDRPMDAFNWYQRHLQFPLEDEQRARARERADALRPRVAVVQVQTEPANAELYVDRVELGMVGRAPGSFAVAPGEHRLIARLPGYRDASAQFSASLAATAATTLGLQQLLGRVDLASEPRVRACSSTGAARRSGSRRSRSSCPRARPRSACASTATSSSASS